MNHLQLISDLNNILAYETLSISSTKLLKYCIKTIREDLEKETFSLNSLIGMDVSIDVSTGDDDSCNRVFATVYDYVEGQPITLLCNDVTANFVTTSSAEEVLSDHAQLRGLTK